MVPRLSAIACCTWCWVVVIIVIFSSHSDISYSLLYFFYHCMRDTSIERSSQKLNHLVSDFTICNVDIFNKLSEFISNFPITVIIDRLWHSLSHRGGGPTAGSRRLTARSRGCDKAVFPPSCIQPLPRCQRQHILSHLVSDLFFAICWYFNKLSEVMTNLVLDLNIIW